MHSIVSTTHTLSTHMISAHVCVCVSPCLLKAFNKFRVFITARALRLNGAHLFYWQLLLDNGNWFFGTATCIQLAAKVCKLVALYAI